MPELPEVETTVRGLERVLEGRRIARVEARRPDLRRALPDDLGQRLTGARVTGLRPPRQIRPDRHRPRRHAGLPPRHVGPLADRSERDRQARPFHHRDRRRAAARAQRCRAASARSTSCATDELDDWPPFEALGPEPLDLDAARAAAAARRPHGGDQAAAARPADRRRPRQHLCVRGAVPRRHPSRARRRIDLARAAEAAGAGDPRRARRSDRGGRIDACAISPAPTASSAISPRASRSTTGKGSRARCGGTVKRIVQGGRSTFYCPALPALTLTALASRGAPLRCEPAGRAVFH